MASFDHHAVTHDHALLFGINHDSSANNTLLYVSYILLSLMHMSKHAKPLVRLTRMDWMEAALSVLASGGIQAVTVDRQVNEHNDPATTAGYFFRDKIRFRGPESGLPF